MYYHCFMLLPLRSLMSFTVRSLEAPLLADQVSISLSRRFNRRTHPDPHLEQRQLDSWAQLQTQNPRLFNATKFRLHGLHAEPNKLHLDLGLTDYASYLGTCCALQAPELRNDGQRQHQDPYAFLSRKVGVAAALETSDGHVALIKRSKSVGMYQDQFDTPGGHPEPQHIHLTEDVLRTLEEKGQEDAKRQMEDAARREFFVSIATEVQEEVNVSVEKQQPPQLLGVVLQTDSCTPSFSFHVKIECSADELRELYRQGPSDKFESVTLELLPVERLLEGSTMLEKLQLTPSAEGTLGLWKEHTLRARQA